MTKNLYHLLFLMSLAFLSAGCGRNELQMTDISLRRSGNNLVMEKNGTKLLDILIDAYTDRISEFRLWQDTEPNRPAPILDLYNMGKCGEVVIRFANDVSLDPGVWILGIPPSTRGTGHNHFMLNRDGATAYLIVDENQHVGIGNFDSHPADGQHPDALLEVRGVANETQLLVKGHSTQTMNLSEWQNSSGTVFVTIDENGKLYVNDELQAAGDAYFATTSGDVGIGTTDPGAKLDVSNGNIAVSTQGNGIILKATDGNKCYLLTVNNNGVLSTTEIACP